MFILVFSLKLCNHIYIYICIYIYIIIPWKRKGPNSVRVLRASPPCRLAREAWGTLGPIYPHVAWRRPRRVCIRFAFPYLNFIIQNFIFPLGRLSAEHLSLNLDVLLGRRGPPYQIWRSLFFPYSLDLVFYCCLIVSRSLSGCIFDDCPYLVYHFPNMFFLFLIDFESSIYLI